MSALTDRIVDHPMRAGVAEEMAAAMCGCRPDLAASILDEWDGRWRRQGVGEPTTTYEVDFWRALLVDEVPA